MTINAVVWRAEVYRGARARSVQCRDTGNPIKIFESGEHIGERHTFTCIDMTLKRLLQLNIRICSVHGGGGGHYNDKQLPL